jgi:hypothetical protein
MKAIDIIGRVLAQITSGRWLITIAATYCLIVLTKTLCTLMEQGKLVLETATYVAVVMSVLNVISTISIFYFNKSRPDTNGNGDLNDPSDPSDLNTKNDNGVNNK